MRLKREQMNQSAQNTMIVVNSTGVKLPVWKPGAETEGKGFTWKTKQKMVQAWESYQLSEGLHAPKTFKSMIDPELVPLICAECSLEERDWEVLDDVALLSAIEERLKPHDAMDFTVQLRRIVFESNEQKGTLTQRYRLFAEPFLAKVSEAKAAGCQLQENVIKLTFSRAVSSSAIIQGWLEQEKWVSAAETHRRITNQLKLVDAYQTLSSIMGPSTAPAPQAAPPAPPAQQHVPVHQPAAPVSQHNRTARFNAHVQASVNAAMAAYQQQQQHQHHHQSGNGAPAPPPAQVNFAQQQQRPARLPPFPGLDTRGINWHLHGPALGCKTYPCQAPFCQACGVHHHTADECRKRQYNNPGVNTSGYWSEQKPNCAPLRAVRPAATANVAVQAPTFPTPYSMNGQPAPAAPVNGGSVNMSQQQPDAPPHQGANGKSQ